MRLWSIHPKYLDSKGLTACWREGLLARKVLLGETQGYRNHPQLIRFRAMLDPVSAIDVFLSAILYQSKVRGYNYDASKINLKAQSKQIYVTQGQMEYEIEHLKRKLKTRDKLAYERILSVEVIDPNPIFTVIEGQIEHWEVVPQQ